MGNSRYKFQAWDNVKSKMYSVGEEDNIHFVWEGGQTVGYDLNEEQDSPDYKLEHLKYRQYTGLKDKNGVEVYKGDILKRDSYWKAFVGHEDGAYRWIPCDPVQRANFRPDRLNVLDAESLTYWEVIGNIYENPELLEGNR